jgi:hypothetical protein
MLATLDSFIASLLGRTLVRRAWQLTLLVVAITLPAASAFAEPTAADRATARALAGEGHRALKQSNFKVAEDRFRRADALVHAPTLVVAHARALVGLGRLVEAHERYQLVLREGVSENALRSWKRALKDAQTEIETIKPRLAWLTLTVQGPEQPTVVVDERELPSAMVGVRTATDPGTRVIKVSAPGFLPEAESLTLAEGEEQSLEIVLEPDPDAAVPPPEPEAAPPSSAEQQPLAKPEVAKEPRDHTLTYIAFGIGGAGLITWAAAGIPFLQAQNDLKDKCPNDHCPATESDSVDRYRKLGTIAGIGMGVGLAGIGVGLALLLSDDSGDPAAEQAQAGIAPYVAPGAVGVHGRF